jgi:hypothetical protein
MTGFETKGSCIWVLKLRLQAGDSEEVPCRSSTYKLEPGNTVDCSARFLDHDPSAMAFTAETLQHLHTSLSYSVYSKLDGWLPNG